MNKTLTTIIITSMLLFLSYTQVQAANDSIEIRGSKDFEKHFGKEKPYLADSTAVNAKKKLTLELVELCPYAETKFEKKWCMLQIKPLLNNAAMLDLIPSKIQILNKIHTEFAKEFKNSKS